MNPHSNAPGGSGPEDLRAEALLKGDMEALRQCSLERLPRFENFAGQLSEASRLKSQEGYFMRSIRSILAHPGRAAALTAAGVALILTIVPVTYQRTVGYEARLRVAGPVVPGSLGQIASQWKGLLGAETVEARTETRSGATTTTFVARVPALPRAMRNAAMAFARGLAARGLTAGAELDPRVEHVLGSVYAMAADRIQEFRQEFRIDVRGKTEAQIEQEIRSRLQAVGATNPEVKVSKTGDQTRITIHTDKAPTNRRALEHVTVGDVPESKVARVEIHSDHKMTDAETKAEVERQLKAKGVDAEVQVINGRINIDVKHKK